MRLVEQIMGMPITIDIWDCQDSKLFERVFTSFHKIDERFSTYKPDSEVSRFRRGEIKEAELSNELKSVIKECQKAEAATNGFFSAWATKEFDPSGYVKGWAIQQAAEIIEKQGHKTYCISAGGDILASSNSAKVWNIGIQNPTKKDEILNMLSISNGAICTSGNYERGNHIINPKTGQPATDLLSITITGPEIIMADILATACFAAGQDYQDILNRYKNYKAIVVKA